MDYTIEYKPLDIICRQGDPSDNLFFLIEGRLLICTVQGTEVKAIARISPGEFIGELSFFDGMSRSAHIVALEQSRISLIPREEIIENLPIWFKEVGKNLTKKIRLLDQIIHSSRLRKAESEDQKPLNIEEQRQILAALNK